MKGIVTRQSDHLRIRFAQSAAKNTNQLRQQFGLLAQDFHDLQKWDWDGLCLFKRYGPIRANVLIGAELSHDVTALAHVIGDFVTIWSDRSQLDKAALQKEEPSVFVSQIVENLVL